MQIKAESLAYWYFRLNGFLTIRDFLVHPDDRRDRGTDVDILGVRFPYRAELFTKPMKDDPIFTRISDCPYIVIAEVKKGLCSLNGPWTKPEHRNMHKVLRAIGAFPRQEVDRIAEDLYSQGYFASSDYYLTLFCIGERKNTEIAERYKEVPQAIWDDIKAFVYERFREYRYQKSWHDPWDIDAKNLWDCMEVSRDQSQFAARIEITS
jgi:hypothetical protein